MRQRESLGGGEQANLDLTYSVSVHYTVYLLYILTMYEYITLCTYFIYLLCVLTLCAYSVSVYYTVYLLCKCILHCVLTL